MSFAKVNVEINQEELRSYVNEKLDETFREVLFTWDVQEMSKRTCMSKSSLENDILHDLRMRLIQRQKPSGKRYWFYKESLEVIRQIMDEW